MNIDNKLMPLITVVTPSYNQGKFIRETIESVLGQDYPRLQYIVVDGGSTDETLEILKEYDGKLSWISESDDGQTDAINKGMRLAKGEILAYLNSDDLYEEKSLFKVAEIFMSNKNIDLIYGDFNYINIDGKLVSQRRTIDFDFGAFRYDHCFICQPSSFWRRSVFDEIGLFKEQLYYYMDYDFYLRAASAGLRFHHVRAPLANLRLHTDCKTVNGSVDGRNKMLIEREQVLFPYRIKLSNTVITHVLHKVLKIFYRIKILIHQAIQNRQVNITPHKRLMNSVYDGDV